MLGRDHALSGALVFAALGPTLHVTGPHLAVTRRGRLVRLLLWISKMWSAAGEWFGVMILRVLFRPI